MNRESALRLIATIVLLLAFATAGRAQSTDQVTYYHTDAIGSVRMITDATGQVVQRHDYLPFGEEWTQPAQRDQRMFAGKERDPETGFDYFGGRYYTSGNGRFTTVDPILDVEQALVDPQRWNRYAYVENNPQRKVDPDGRQTVDLVIGFSQGIGSAAVGMIRFPFALVSDPSGTVRSAAGGFADDLRLLSSGLQHPSELWDAYVTLATSSNNADQRKLGAVFGSATVAAALTIAPIRGASARVQALDVASDVSKVVKIRPTPGGDGATSRIILEQSDGTTISVTHQVEKNGSIIHQHQTHIGSYGTERRFPDEWTEYPTVP